MKTVSAILFTLRARTAGYQNLLSLNKRHLVTAEEEASLYTMLKTFPRQIIKAILTRVRRLQGITTYRRIARFLRGGIEIKEADEEDIREVSKWLNINHDQCDISSNTTFTSLIAKKGSQIVGYADIARRSEQHYLHGGYWLHSLMVRPLYQGMGIGEELTRIVIEKSREEGAKKLSLLVDEHNYRAIRLYRKLGFEIRMIPTLESQQEDERRSLTHKYMHMIVILG